MSRWAEQNVPTGKIDVFPAARAAYVTLALTAYEASQEGPYLASCILQNPMPCLEARLEASFKFTTEPLPGETQVVAAATAATEDEQHDNKPKGLGDWFTRVKNKELESLCGGTDGSDKAASNMFSKQVAASLTDIFLNEQAIKPVNDECNLYVKVFLESCAPGKKNNWQLICLLSVSKHTHRSSACSHTCNMQCAIPGF